MTLPPQRSGTRLKVNNKLIQYSFWPTRAGKKGNASLQSLLFSLDPWAIIDQVIKSTCPPLAKSEALACLAQARDFYEGATDTRRIAARPLSLYYCFMNLVKAFCLTRATRTTFDKAHHGLTEKLRASNRELTDAYLTAFPSPSTGSLNNFAEFQQALTGTALSATIDLDIPILLPQILPGHRLWAFASGKKERFVAVHDIRPYVDKITKKTWLNIYFVADDLSRIGVTVKNFLSESALAPDFVQVACDDEDASGRRLICFEQVNPIVCGSTKYANYLQNLFDTTRPKLWETVATVPPYRRHYVYLRPAAENSQVVSQLLSVYALSYYFGSITRYRPHHFPKITDGVYGPRVQDFITGQPQQFLYLLASEFAKREIAKPSII